MAFDGLDVVIQVNVLRSEVPVRADLLVNLKIDVAEEAMVADGEEPGDIAQRASPVEHQLSIVHDGVADNIVHLTHVESELGAVFATESRTFRDGVVDLQLCSHLAVGLGRISVHRRQAVGVGIVDGRDEVDVEVVLLRRVHRLEAHVVDTFHLQHGAKAFLRIAQRSHQGLAFLINEVVDGRGVVDLVCILCAERNAAIAQIDATCGGTNVFGDIVEQALVVLFLADKTTADAHPELGIVEGGDALVEVPFAIHAAHDATIIVGGEIAFKIRRPIIALTAIQAFQRHAFGGSHHDTHTAQRVVHA